jgi:MFS family permease
LPNAGQWQAVTINLTPDPTLDQSPTMSRTELRASGSLASIFAVRMLGLFLVLPVFALEARKYPGGDDPALIGLAMGIYGLTQAMLQIPFGVASDRLGRKRVIIFGLLIFALGSLVAGSADTLMGVLAGRALQGKDGVFIWGLSKIEPNPDQPVKNRS